ncbi:carbohydrate sulfotransferase 11-like [Amphiura filiformis]|uniref:carbohydrate sulfotransferase 11-like n=1 Tax=Amphiura filiformis TaxID=82378 RepID=UPI003B22814E
MTECIPQKTIRCKAKNPPWLTGDLQFNLLTERQFGFLPNSSTTDALLTAILDWHNAVEARKDVVVALYDLAKAFNKVPHRLLLLLLAYLVNCCHGLILTLQTDTSSHGSNANSTKLPADVEQMLKNKTYQISEGIQEQRVQHIKRVCTEEYKIQPLPFDAKDKRFSSLLRERFETTLVNDDYKLLVTFVYKTGSQGWTELFRQLYERGQNVSQTKLGSKHNDGVIGLALVLKWYGINAVVDRLKHYFSVIFVRHPYTRLISGYKDKLVKIPNKYYEKKARDIIRQVRKIPLPSSQTPDLKFDEFVQFVANGGWDEHWCPIFDDKKPCHVHYDFIGHLETFQDDVAYLFHLVGIDNIVKFPECPHATGSGDLAILKEHFSQISQTLLTKLNARYKKDFKVFGYRLPRNNTDFIKMDIRGAVKR